MDKNELKNIELDEYGRVIINDCNVLELIAGAIAAETLLGDDNASCDGPNSSCSNSGCG